MGPNCKYFFLGTNCNFLGSKWPIRVKWPIRKRDVQKWLEVGTWDYFPMCFFQKSNTPTLHRHLHTHGRRETERERGKKRRRKGEERNIGGREKPFWTWEAIVGLETLVSLNHQLMYMCIYWIVLVLGDSIVSQMS